VAETVERIGGKWNAEKKKNFFRTSFAGLPDGLFSDQKSQFWLIFWHWKGKFGYILWSFWYFRVHLVYFASIWHILWQLCRYIFSHFGMFQQEKSGNPASSAFFHSISFHF
jgi:hypothetical protein